MHISRLVFFSVSLATPFFIGMTPDQRVCAEDAVGTSVKTVIATPVSAVSKANSASAGDTADGQKFLLQYRMKPGESIGSRVTHLAKTMTKVSDEQQASHCRTVSTKNWKVLSVQADGSMTFEHSVREVDASNQVGDANEVRYNSDHGDVPKQFADVHGKVDQVISTITIMPSGEVVDRTADDKYAKLNLGEIAIRFPEHAIGIGEQWETEREVQVRRGDKTPMKVNIREVFTLQKVSAGVAVIQVRNEPLTPIREPEVEAQVMQQMNNGTIRFDVDAGRLIKKEMNWDSTVIGFSGAGSRLEYSASLEEELL